MINLGVKSSASVCLRFPFALEFESEWLNGNLVTKQSPNYHLAFLEKSVEWLNAIWCHLTNFIQSDKW